MFSLRNPAAVISGLFLIATAALFFWAGRNLSVGTITQMGAGYVPNLLCLAQATLGLAVLAIGLVKKGEPLEAWRGRPVLVILASVGFFAVSVEQIGLVAAVIGTVVLSGLATPLSRHIQNTLLGMALAVFAVLVFVKALNLQIPVWPAGWGR